MFGEHYLFSEGRYVICREGAVVAGGGYTGNAIAAFLAGHLGREVRGVGLSLPHAGEATHHQNLGKVVAAVDEVGDALGGIKLGKVHLILFHSLHELHLDDVQVVCLGGGHFHLHIPVGRFAAVQQAFPEPRLALAAYADDAGVNTIHVAIGTHPGIPLLQHIKTRLAHLPGSRDKLGAGVAGISDENEGEAHGVRYSASLASPSQRKYLQVMYLLRN